MFNGNTQIAFIGNSSNFYVNDQGNAVAATRFGQLLGTFWLNEKGICKQHYILEEEINCKTTLSVREAETRQSFSGGQ